MFSQYAIKKESVNNYHFTNLWLLLFFLFFVSFPKCMLTDLLCWSRDPFRVCLKKTQKEQLVACYRLGKGWSGWQSCSTKAGDGFLCCLPWGQEDKLPSQQPFFILWGICAGRIRSVKSYNLTFSEDYRVTLRLVDNILMHLWGACSSRFKKNAQE